MADKFGNYISAFLMAGGFGVIASIIPFLFLCVKRETVQLADHDIEFELDQVQSEGIDIEEQDPKSTRLSQESTNVNRTDRHRSTSFITAMENPFF